MNFVHVRYIACFEAIMNTKKSISFANTKLKQAFIANARTLQKLSDINVVRVNP